MVLVALKNLLLPPKPHSPLLPTASKPYGTCPTPPPPSPRIFDPRTLSDLTIGLSDGLTVPFALTAGLSAFNDTRIVVYGGLAELIAGSISMGLGGWLAGRGEAEFYNNTLRSTQALIASSPESIPPLLYEVFAPYGLPAGAVDGVVDGLVGGGEELTGFLMRFRYGLQEKEGRTPVTSAGTIAAGYFFGGFVPLVPYFFVGRGEVVRGLMWSVVVMGVCLFAFGWGKTVLVEGEEKEEGRRWGEACRGGCEMVVVGGVAAGAAMGIVRALGGMS